MSPPSRRSAATTSARAWLEASFSRMRCVRPDFADDEASFGRQAPRRERPRDDAGEHDRAERDYPQRRDLLRTDSPSEDEVLEDGHTKREYAGQLGQLRYIVERGVHEPEIVAVVEAGELEHEQDQSRSDHR